MNSPGKTLRPLLHKHIRPTSEPIFSFPPKQIDKIDVRLPSDALMTL